MMDRRHFITTTGMAGSAAFIGADILGRAGIQSLQARMLLEPAEYKLFQSFVSSYEASLKELDFCPRNIRNLYSITEVTSRKFKDGDYEVKLKNVNNDLIVLIKKGTVEAVKILRAV